ncbi:MAG: tetratricopeptide (TPR) repeat protein [bacterium]|jgi:tetratricopeptide (TPR) repeat protein
MPSETDRIALFERGMLFFQVGKHALAIQDFTSLVEAGECKLLESYYQRGLSHAKLQHYHHAIHDFLELTKLHSQHVDVYYQLAETYKEGCQFSEAVNSYYKYLQLYEEDPELKPERVQYVRETIQELVQKV